ncbi:Helix-turn-helix domain protein [compost metagenome]
MARIQACRDGRRSAWVVGMSRGMAPMSMSNADDEMMNSDEVARWLRVKPDTVRDYARTGRLKSVRPGKSYLFRRAWVDEFLAQDPRIIRRKPRA